jgi:hypothetical protein
MSQSNPYSPPRSQVADVAPSTEWGKFVEGGRSVEAGQGWAWIASAFGLFRKRAAAWIGITVVLFVLLFVLNLIPLIGAIANMLLMEVILGGLFLGCRALEADGEFGVGQLFAGFSNQTGRLIVLGVLTVVGWIAIMVVVFFILGRSMMGLMSGDPAAITAAGPTIAIGVLVALGLSVPLYMALWFAACLVVFEEVQPAQAMGQSFRACLKNIVPFLLYGIVFLVLFFIAAIPLGLGFLVVIPVLIASVYTSYRDIFYAPA